MRQLLALFLMVLSVTVAGAQQRKDAAITSGWVKQPAAGATEAQAFLNIDNPTQYDLFLQKASSDAAGAAEVRTAGKSEPLTFVTVPAYGSLEMDAKGTYLLLRDLKKPLAVGATVRLTMTNDSGTSLTFEAVVKNE